VDRQSETPIPGNEEGMELPVHGSMLSVEDDDAVARGKKSLCSKEERSSSHERTPDSSNGGRMIHVPTHAESSIRRSVEDVSRDRRAVTEISPLQTKRPFTPFALPSRATESNDFSRMTIRACWFVHAPFQAVFSSSMQIQGLTSYQNRPAINQECTSASAKEA
jgi:hypothetical protein